MEALRTNLRWGLRRALLIAAVFSCWALLLSGISGSGAISDRYGISVWGIVAAYFAAAVLGGAVAGVSRPLMRFWPGAVAVGAVVGTLGYGAIFLAGDGWAGFDPTGPLLLGSTVGGGVGFYLWRKSRRSSLSPRA
jgi:CHASE2 domain-containing sensor protein